MEKLVRPKKENVQDGGLSGGCWQCFINKAAGLVADLSPAAVEVFDRAKITRHYPRGSILYHQGSLGHGLFCIRSGRIKVYNTDTSGKLHILRLAGAGDFLGTSSFVTRRPHSSTAEAMSPAVVCLICGEAVRSALESDPQIANNIMSSLAHALENTEAHLATLARLSSTCRIVKVLLENSQPTAHEALVAPLTREEIGNLSSTCIETVSRLLHSLARQGMLRLRVRAIYIVNRAALEDLVTASAGES